MRLIDAERTVIDIQYQHRILQKMGLGELSDVLVNGFLQEIENQPTVDAEPMRHGRWTYRNIGGWKCSECNNQAPFWCMASTQNLSDYCPNCGAKMDGGAE